MSSFPARRASPYSTRFKIVAALVVTVAVGLFTIVALRMPEDSDPVLQSGGTSEFVEALLPASGSQVLQQAPVGIDLAPGWEGTLFVDGQEVPEDQLSVTEALNKVEFAPGPGKVLERWAPGSNCLRAVVWRSSVGRETGERAVSWCFEVV